jgi:hypothetical protein
MLLTENDLSDEDDEDIDQIEPLEYQDIGLVTSASKTRQRNRANKLFSKYLAAVNSPFRNLCDIPEEHMDSKHLGCFVDYIEREVPTVKALKTKEMYLSAIHVQICERFPHKSVLFQRYYENLRSVIDKRAKKRERETGIPSIKHSKRMKFSDLNYMCQKLFKEQKLELRCLIALDWIAVGRVSEVR